MEQRTDCVSGLCAGNAEAIRQWAAQYAPRVQDVSLAYLGDSPDAAALTKRVLEQALKSIRAGYVPADMEDWLLSLARAQGSQAALSKPAQPLPQSAPQPLLRVPKAAPSPVPETPAATPWEEAPFAAPVEYLRPEAVPLEVVPVEPAPTWAAPRRAPSRWEEDAGGMPLFAKAEEDEALFEEAFDDDFEEDFDEEDISLFEEEDADIDLFEDVPLRRSSLVARFFGSLLILLLSLIIAALLWGLAGLMMRLRMLPVYDLGYSWFNAKVFPFF